MPSRNMSILYYMYIYDQDIKNNISDQRCESSTLKNDYLVHTDGTPWPSVLLIIHCSNRDTQLVLCSECEHKAQANLPRYLSLGYWKVWNLLPKLAMEEKSRVLVVGGTGYIGRRIVRASLAQGHPTFVLMRPEIGLDVDKLQMLLSFKAQGARLVEASLDDHAALVAAVKQVDVVISAMAVGYVRSHNLNLQHKLLEAIKEAGNVKRFIPSEFGIDPSRMGHAIEPGKVTFDVKMELRRAIEEANIPHTYISANCFAAYFCPNLCQLGTLLPPKEKVRVYGDGNIKVIFVDEDDVATYTIKSIDDPRTLNKTIYLRPQENILTQNEVIEKWEKLSGKTLEKIPLTAEEFLASMKDMELFHQVGVAHFYHIFFEGCLTNFVIGEDGAEASLLYPEVAYIRMDEYMERYL